MRVAWLLLSVFVCSAIGTGLLRRYALARSMMDMPNERSSHHVPTPRGGGLSIVVAFIAGTLVLAGMGCVPRSTAFAIAGAGAIVAMVGFLDDHLPVAAGWRLIAHFAAAIWALAWLGGLPPIPLLGASIDLGWTGQLLAAVALVWLLNLYNFMDGIDGIAGVEAITVCAGAVLLDVWYALTPTEWALPSVLAAAVLGFLVWNFPSAKIFMGDSGSGFLGLMLGTLAIQAAGVSPNWLWSWIILLGVFVVDATLTLLRRLHRREKVFEAHRSHAYQRAALRAGTHTPVTLAVGAINLFWLLPLALLVGTGRLDGVLGTLIAYLPLVWVAGRLEAGAPTRPARREM
jgi:Fuc2NAc and GlcNAc transferase